MLPEKVYQETTVKKTKETINFYKLFNLELFKNRIYVILVIGMSLTFVSELNIVLMIPFVLGELANFSRDEIAYALSIQSTLDVFGRLVVPAFAHKNKWPPKIMYMSSLIISSIGRTGFLSLHLIRLIN